MAKNTKYVIVDTEEEVQLGDTVEVTLNKTDKKGRRFESTVAMDVSPETIPTLIELEIIEAVKEEKVPTREVEDDYDEEDEEEDCEMSCEDLLKALPLLFRSYDEAIVSLGSRMDKLEAKVQNLQNRMNHKATKPTEKK